MRFNAKKIITFGEVMLRVSPSLIGERLTQARDFIIEPGGSEANVALALSLLGYRCAFVTALPQNALSEKIIRALKSYSVDTSQIAWKEGRVGLYWTETGVGLRPYEVLYDRQYSTFYNIKYDMFDWRNIFKGAAWFHTSGISAAVSENAYRMLKKILSLRKANITVSLDLNYRNKLWEWAGHKKSAIQKVMWSLILTIDVLMGNETDFSDALGFKIDNADGIDGYRKIAESCFKKSRRLKFIAVSLRNVISASDNDWSGLLFVRLGAKLKVFKAVDVKITNIIDRVGTGDSFAAGIIYGLMNKPVDFQRIIDFAVALSALKHTVRGDISQHRLVDVEKFLKNPIARIIR